MSYRVLIVGGTGNFGSHIARRLARRGDIRLILSSRSAESAEAAAHRLGAAGGAEGIALSLDGDVEAVVRAARPDFVIHTSGPFQGQDYRVAEAAIAVGAHYCDLADARAFVAGIGALDEKARAAGVAVIAGASSVPALTAAIIDRYRPRFGRLRGVDYGIGAAQATNRGLSTTAAILSYVGQPFSRLEGGREIVVHGWQGTGIVPYPELGHRMFGECDIPDLALFPARYPELETVRFRAGHELKILHAGAWAMSWAVRSGLIKSLAPYAPLLHRMTLWFDPFGKGKSGFHMVLTGDDPSGRPMAIRMMMVARNAEGPNIPCVPSILLAERLASGWKPEPGARPCLDLITLEDYLEAIADLNVSTQVTGPGLDERWGPPFSE